MLIIITYYKIGLVSSKQALKIGLKIGAYFLSFLLHNENNMSTLISYKEKRKSVKRKSL